MSGRKPGRGKSKGKGKGKGKSKPKPAPQQRPLAAVGPASATATQREPSGLDAPLPLPRAVSWSDLGADSRARLAALYEWPDPVRVGNLAPVATALEAAPVLLLRALEAALAADGLVLLADLREALGGSFELPHVLVDLCITLGVGFLAHVSGPRGEREPALALVRELSGPVAAAACGVSRALLAAPDAADAPDAAGVRPGEAVYDHVILVAGTANAVVKCTPKRTNATSGKAYARHRGVDPDVAIEQLDIATGNGSLRMLEHAAAPDVPRLARLLELHDQTPSEFHWLRNSPLPPCGTWVPRSLLVGAGVDDAYSVWLEASREPPTTEDYEEDDALLRSRPPYRAPLRGWLTPAFEVVLEKDGSLADLAHLVACLELARLDRVATFRISRSSVATGARCGADLVRVRALLGSLSAGGTPESVARHLDDWFAAALAPDNLTEADSPPPFEPAGVGWERFLAPPAAPRTRERVEQADPLREVLDLERMLLLALQRELVFRLNDAIPALYQPKVVETAARALQREYARLSPVIAKLVRERQPTEGLRLVTGVYNPTLGPVVGVLPRTAQAAELARFAACTDPEEFVHSVMRRHVPDKRGGALMPLLDPRYATTQRLCEERYIRDLHAALDRQLEHAAALMVACPLARQLNDEAEIAGSMLTGVGRRRVTVDEWEDDDEDDDAPEDDDGEWTEEEEEDDDDEPGGWQDNLQMLAELERLLRASATGSKPPTTEGRWTQLRTARVTQPVTPQADTAPPVAAPPAQPTPPKMSSAEIEATLNAAAAASLTCVVEHARGAATYRVELMGPAGVVLGGPKGKQEYVLFRDIERVHVRVPN